MGRGLQTGIGLALAAVLSGPAFAQTPGSPEGSPDPSVQALAHITLQEYAEACAVLDAHYPRGSANADVEFLRGQCLLGQGDLVGARAAFERVIELDPDAVRARYELARVYEAEQNDAAARLQYERILSSAPPASVRRVIERALTASHAARPWRLQASIGALYDSNINGGPDDADIVLYGLPFTLSPSSVSIDSGGVAASVAGGYSFRLGDHLLFAPQAALSHTAYAETRDFDVTTLTAFAALATGGDKWRAAFGPRATAQGVGGELYRVLYGGDAELSLHIAPEWRVGAALSAAVQDYETAHARDGAAYQAALRLDHDFGAFAISLGYSAREEEAEDDFLSNFAHGPRLEASWAIGDLVLDAGYAFARTDYEADDPIAGQARRDETQLARAGLSWRVQSGAVLRLSYAYSEQQSNIDIYDTDRAVTQLTWERSF